MPPVDAGGGVAGAGAAAEEAPTGLRTSGNMPSRFSTGPVGAWGRSTTSKTQHICYPHIGLTLALPDSYPTVARLLPEVCLLHNFRGSTAVPPYLPLLWLIPVGLVAFALAFSLAKAIMLALRDMARVHGARSVGQKLVACAAAGRRVICEVLVLRCLPSYILPLPPPCSLPCLSPCSAEDNKQNHLPKKGKGVRRFSAYNKVTTGPYAWGSTVCERAPVNIGGASCLKTTKLNQ